jgi:hypothetical protein
MTARAPHQSTGRYAMELRSTGNFKPLTSCFSRKSNVRNWPDAGIEGKNADFRGHRLLQTVSGSSLKFPKTHQHVESSPSISPEADPR